MNTTFTNPASVSGSQNVTENGFNSPKGHSTVVDQLAHKAASWEALKPVEAPTIGTPAPDEVLRVDAPRHDWPVYLVNVPEDWQADSWRSVPPYTTAYKKAKTAAEIAAILNRERITNSNDGFVSHWYIRVRVGSKYANLSVALPTPWKPENEFDLPPAFIRIDGSRDQCKQIVGDLNYRLDHCEPGEVRKRAYIARSICPADLEPWPIQAETQAGESQSEPVELQTTKGGHCVPLNQTAEDPEEMEGPPEVYRVNTGYQFDVEPSCGEEIMIHVYNESDELKAKAMVEAYLKQHAIDLLKSGVLDRELRVNRLGGEIR
ncbi:hypothetical protein [Gimesia maris]|uniref:hypothetical protein n=1 Tax=Gimesia maris TaxID=122 RepID=UPI003A8E7DD4